MLISFLHSLRSSFRSTVSARGFTLVELLVVSTIILLMTSYIFFQQSKFNSTTLLRSLTYSVALSVRQAQVYGTSVKGTTVAQASCTAGTYSSGACFANGFGVHIPATGANASTYYIFADLNGDGAYATGEELPVFTLGRGYRITQVCAVPVGGSTCTTLSALTVYFRRPDPDACLSTNADGKCADGVAAVYSRAYITISDSNNSDSRSVKITQTGQISVCTPNLSDVTQC